MPAWSLLVLCLAAGPSVELATLKGESHVGSLERLSGDEIVLKTPTGNVSIPAGELLSVRVPATGVAPANVEAAAEVRLVDGTRLRVTGFVTDAASATVEHPQLGSLKLPLSVVQSVRFAAADA